VSPDSRCYFVTARGDSVGQYPVRLSDRVACGPVVFVDGDVRVPYLEFPVAVSTPTNEQVTLSVPKDATPYPTSGPPIGQRLVRPDRVQPPDGSGGLTRPEPPPAIGDVLTKAVDVSPRPSQTSLVMIGRTSGVRLTNLGVVDRYGLGDNARTAPEGRKLIAFSLRPLAGEAGDDEPKLYIRVDGRKRGPLAMTDEYVVTAVATNAKQADLVLADSGGEQSISLLTGTAASGNPMVTARKNRMVKISVTKPVTVKVSGPRGAGVTSGRVSFTALSLTYWAPDGSHASGARRALLQIVASIRLESDSSGYGAEAGLLSAAATGDTPARARNAAVDRSRQIVAVVDVPADITAGTVRFSGSAPTAAKGTLTIQTPVQFQFTIAAG